MELWEKKADLCFCLGTSLSGMNADRMAHTPAKVSNFNMRYRINHFRNLKKEKLSELY
jgi:hypothetical protein